MEDSNTGAGREGEAHPGEDFNDRDGARTPAVWAVRPSMAAVARASANAHASAPGAGALARAPGG